MLLSFGKGETYHGESFEGFFESILQGKFASDPAVLRGLGHLVVILPDLADDEAGLHGGAGRHDLLLRLCGLARPDVRLRFLAG